MAKSCQKWPKMVKKAKKNLPNNDQKKRERMQKNAKSANSAKNHVLWWKTIGNQVRILWHCHVITQMACYNHPKYLKPLQLYIPCVTVGLFSAEREVFFSSFLGVFAEEKFWTETFSPTDPEGRARSQVDPGLSPRSAGPSLKSAIVEDVPVLRGFRTDALDLYTGTRHPHWRYNSIIHSFPSAGHLARSAPSFLFATRPHFAAFCLVLGVNMRIARFSFFASSNALKFCIFLYNLHFFCTKKFLRKAAFLHFFCRFPLPFLFFSRDCTGILLSYQTIGSVCK